jgi:hypothetical protein
MCRASPGLPSPTVTEPSYLSATREAYDTVAAAYALHPNSSLAGRPLDRALLAAFAELVQAAGAGTRAG